MREKKDIFKDSVSVRDRPLKSIFKSLTWRLIASTTTFLLTYYIFRDDPHATEKATGVATAEAVIKMALYFFHERAWNTVKWGKMKVYIRKYNIYRYKIKKRIYLNSK